MGRQVMTTRWKHNARNKISTPISSTVFASQAEAQPLSIPPFLLISQLTLGQMKTTK